jgi:DNA polymerase
MLDTRDISEILGLLDWYRSMGADAAIGADPVDWLARGAEPPGHEFVWPDRPSPAVSNGTGSQSAAAPRAAAGQISETKTLSPAIREGSAQAEVRPRPQTPLAASEAQTDARRIAQTAGTLDELGAALASFDGCSLKATATKLCFYRGSPTARLMVIGEAPGRDEDLEGRPFVGRAGQMLDKMLNAIGLQEADVHITNVVYWRPPGNRTPTPQEALACRPFLERQVELVRPDFILALGGSAAKEVLGVTDGIMRLRGKWRDVSYGKVTLPALATLHPAYLLRTPAAKQLAWLDLLAVKSRLRG